MHPKTRKTQHCAHCRRAAGEVVVAASLEAGRLTCHFTSRFDGDTYQLIPDEGSSVRHEIDLAEISGMICDHCIADLKREERLIYEGDHIERYLNEMEDLLKTMPPPPDHQGRNPDYALAVRLKDVQGTRTLWFYGDAGSPGIRRGFLMIENLTRADYRLAYHKRLFGEEAEQIEQAYDLEAAGQRGDYVVVPVTPEEVRQLALAPSAA